ncbi:MAG: 30S ribosomal protein S16 [Chlamydiae bacterium]|nr:30S ribosomal protein S16 [Chlamydiota bacterium]
MALKIRLRQQGRKNEQTYRIVVADSRIRRDGSYVEKLGHYIPYLEKDGCVMDGERLLHWLSLGAKMSDQVRSLAAKTTPEALKKFQNAQEKLKQQRIMRKKAKKAEAAGA